MGQVWPNGLRHAGATCGRATISGAMAYRVLLDTSSLMYRAFFSVPPSVKDRSGQSVNALHGYLDMVGYLIEARHPDQVVHVYDDDWRPAPRVALYAGYKANRAPDPEGLPPQF